MLLEEVVVVSVEAAGYYAGEYTSGSTVKVTLQRGEEVVSCDDILIWEQELADNDLFDEWVALALDGEEGYVYIAGCTC